VWFQMKLLSVLQMPVAQIKSLMMLVCILLVSPCLSCSPGVMYFCTHESETIRLDICVKKIQIVMCIWAVDHSHTTIVIFVHV